MCKYAITIQICGHLDWQRATLFETCSLNTPRFQRRAVTETDDIHCQPGLAEIWYEKAESYCEMCSTLRDFDSQPVPLSWLMALPNGLYQSTSKTGQLIELTALNDPAAADLESEVMEEIQTHHRTGLLMQGQMVLPETSPEQHLQAEGVNDGHKYRGSRRSRLPELGSAQVPATRSPVPSSDLLGQILNQPGPSALKHESQATGYPDPSAAAPVAHTSRIAPGPYPPPPLRTHHPMDQGQFRLQDTQQFSPARSRLISQGLACGTTSPTISRKRKKRGSATPSMQSVTRREWRSQSHSRMACQEATPSRHRSIRRGRATDRKGA